ncbi:MAG: PmbA protein [Phenylobacterium sp.]|jgi:PmbA protein
MNREKLNMADSKQTINNEIDEVKSKIEDALALAQSYGATSAEIAISRQKGLAVSTRMQEVETVEFNQDGALGITVYRGAKKGSASTSDLSEEALQRTVKAACDIAHYTSEDECAGLADKELLAMSPEDLDLYHPTVFTPEQGIEFGIAAEAAAFAVSDKITNSDGATFSAHEGFRVYGNSHGQMVGYPSSRYSLNCGMIAQGDDEMQREYEYTVSREANQLMSAEEIGRKASNSALKKLNARKIESVKVPVIFRADVADSLFGHLVSAIGGGALYRKSTFLLDRIDTDVMAKHINIIERPFLAKGLASSAFDSEGVATHDRDIIVDGRLNSYLLGSYSARKLNLTSTGHAGGIHNWLVDPTMGDLAAMAKTMGRGLLVTELMGQGINMVTGDYSRGADGFWVEGGEIQYPVTEVTIAGNLADMFMNIVGCGSDVDLRGNVRCGSVLLEQMSIAGA